MSSTNTVVHVMKHIRRDSYNVCIMLVTNKAAIHVPLVLVVVSDIYVNLTSQMCVTQCVVTELHRRFVNRGRTTA